MLVFHSKHNISHLSCEKNGLWLVVKLYWKNWPSHIKNAFKKITLFFFFLNLEKPGGIFFKVSKLLFLFNTLNEITDVYLKCLCACPVIIHLGFVMYGIVIAANSNKRCLFLAAIPAQLPRTGQTPTHKHTLTHPHSHTVTARVVLLMTRWTLTHFITSTNCQL